MPNPVPPFIVTTPYGTPGQWAAGYHTGDDYSTHGKTGIPVYATRRGRVMHSIDTWGPAYGVHVVVAGPTGTIRMGYAHLMDRAVRPGQWVRRGQLLGFSGATGRVTGPHLHYEERRPPWRYSDHRRPRFNRA